MRLIRNTGAKAPGFCDIYIEVTVVVEAREVCFEIADIEGLEACYCKKNIAFHQKLRAFLSSSKRFLEIEKLFPSVNVAWEIALNIVKDRACFSLANHRGSVGAIEEYSFNEYSSMSLACLAARAKVAELSREGYCVKWEQTESDAIAAFQVSDLETPSARSPKTQKDRDTKAHQQAISRVVRKADAILSPADGAGPNWLI